MKLRYLSTYIAAVVVAAAGVLVPSQAFATVISLYDVDGMHVNRVINGSTTQKATVYHDEFFSTHNTGQQSYATISNADLLAALTAALGPLGGGESYVINSATFFAGSTDGYADASVGAYVTTSYDPTTLTYNNQPQTGGTPTTTALSFGSVSGSTTTWDVSGGVDAVSDTSLFWETGTGTQFTAVTAGDVHLEVDATIVPEPMAIVLAVIGLVGLVARRRRRG